MARMCKILREGVTGWKKMGGCGVKRSENVFYGKIKLYKMDKILPFYCLPQKSSSHANGCSGLM
jgi:hypothetical protein